MKVNLDCRHYIGEKPCVNKRTCEGCPHYSPMGARVIILKLGAIGDALRTTPVLHALSRVYPIRHVTWVTDRQSIPVLKRNKMIDRLIVAEPQEMFSLIPQQYDLLLSFDKAPVTLSLAMQINARIRRGFALTPWGTLDVFNDASEYSWMLGLDDELKFRRNQKSYQEIIHEMAELPYERDRYIYDIHPDDLARALEKIKNLKPSGQGIRIGLNTGCGDVFATKKWPDEYFRSLAELLYQKENAGIYLLGGAKEKDANQRMAAELKGIAVDTGVNDLGEFAGILSQMDIVVTGDTMALHLALAVGTRTIALFGPTCAQEIDLYDSGIKLVAHADCSPCYRSRCLRSRSCLYDILPEHILDAVVRLKRTLKQ